MNNNNLWAPWRMTYINGLDGGDKPGGGESPKCFLCEAGEVADDPIKAKERLIVHHDDRGLIMLNRYPYTNGHLLIALPEHLASLSDMSIVQRGGLMELTEMGERLLTTAVNAQGVNIGINLGRCAGAGLPGHLHVHIVPRWNGDTNFMATVGQVRVVPQALEETYAYLVEAMVEMESRG